MNLKMLEVPEELILPVQTLARAACLLQGVFAQAIEGCPVDHIVEDRGDYLELACQVIDLWAVHLGIDEPESTDGWNRVLQ